MQRQHSTSPTINPNTTRYTEITTNFFFLSYSLGKKKKGNSYALQSVSGYSRTKEPSHEQLIDMFKNTQFRTIIKFTGRCLHIRLKIPEVIK